VLRYLGMLNNIYPLIIVYLVYTLADLHLAAEELLRADPPRNWRTPPLVDGATRLQVLWKVFIPVRRPPPCSPPRSCPSSWPGTTSRFAVSFLTSQAHFHGGRLAITHRFGQSSSRTFYKPHRRGGW